MVQRPRARPRGQVDWVRDPVLDQPREHRPPHRRSKIPLRRRRGAGRTAARELPFPCTRLTPHSIPPALQIHSPYLLTPPSSGTLDSRQIARFGLPLPPSKPFYLLSFTLRSSRGELFRPEKKEKCLLVKSFSRSLETFRTAIVVGGTNIAEQRSELRAGVHVVVATPGRFIDHLQQGNTSLSRISFVVLDEADRMLDMGFEPQIREIDRLLSLLVEEASQAENFGRAHPLTIVFVERKTRCDEVAEALVAQGLQAVALHGGRSQNEREAALREFRKGSTNILVATDVASRGLDVTGVAHVINLDLPKSMEDYVHRIGRTGRAGSMGQATSFYVDRDMFLVAQIRKAITDVESGNTIAIATGKVARRKEREAAAAHRDASHSLSKLTVNGPASINIEDKYQYMLTPTTLKKEGSADDAWDD